MKAGPWQCAAMCLQLNLRSVSLCQAKAGDPAARSSSSAEFGASEAWDWEVMQRGVQAWCRSRLCRILITSWTGGHSKATAAFQAPASSLGRSRVEDVEALTRHGGLRRLRVFELEHA